MAYLDEQGNITTSTSTPQYLDEQGNPSPVSQPSWTPSPVNPVSDEDLRDLYKNARKFGVSGLSRGQQELFVQQFPYSKAAKSGMSLADAIKATDAGSAVPQPIVRAMDGVIDKLNYAAEFPSNAYKTARTIIAAPAYKTARTIIAAPVATAAGLGSFIGNTVKDSFNGTPVDLGKNLRNAAEYTSQTFNEADAGQGLPGAVADPINYVPIFDAGAVAKLVPKYGLKFASKLAESGWVPRAVGGGAVGAGENAALTWADNSLNPGRDESMKGSIIGGGSMGAISGALPESHFVSELPGITTLVNRANTPADKQRILDAAADMYHNSTLLGLPLLGGGKGSYQRVANQSLEKSTDLYKDLEKNVLESGELPGEVRNATNVSGVPVTSNPVTIMNSRQYTSTPLSTADMKEGMLESLDNQNREDKAGFTKDQLSKAVDSYLDRVSAVMPESDPRDFIRADQYVPPKDIFDSKTWLNNDIYNAKQEPGAGQKAKLADMLHMAVNERIGKMTDASGQTQQDLSSAAGKAYSDYKLKQKIVDQGIRSASSRNGNSFWVPTALGKSIKLGTQLDASLTR